MLDGPVLVVAAHADDEALGAGGTLATARRAGQPIHVLILSTSCTSRPAPAEAYPEMQKARQRDAALVASGFGAGLTLEDFPDNAFDSIPAVRLVAAVERTIRAVRPRLVLTHWPGDLSLDHGATARAVLAACRPQPGHVSPTIWSFEIRSSTDWIPGPGNATFQPTVYVPLDEEAWAAKLAALHAYRSEMRPFPHARSVEGLDALARLRGTEIGHPRAEAFALLRHILAR